MKFNHVVCGGTFDHLHVGHKKLLNECIQNGKKVTVGITTGAMARHKAFNFSIESYEKRVQNIIQFNSTLNTYQLSNIFGPTLTDITIDAIFVTEDTLSGAYLINDKRKQIGMKPLSIQVVPFILDENEELISSVHIRQGLIDREGRSYGKLLFSREKHILPDSLKGELRDPLGRIFSSVDKITPHHLKKLKTLLEESSDIRLISIGDVITYNFKKINIYPFLSIIDGKTCRKALDRDVINALFSKDRIEAPNEKGTIQQEAIKCLYNILVSGHNRAINQLFIHGEEDLLTLVAVLLAPLESHVWYGQQGVGAIDVRVTEKKKQIVYNLVRQFE